MRSEDGWFTVVSGIEYACVGVCGCSNMQIFANKIMNKGWNIYEKHLHLTGYSACTTKKCEDWNSFQ